MTTLTRIIGFFFLSFLVYFTSSKLVKMAQIRGFIQGPDPVSKVITEKAVLPGSYGDAYWIAWDSVNIRSPSKSRICLPEDKWNRYLAGDKFDVFLFPGETWAYSREDIYASDENFGFDGVLLLLWVVGIATLGYFQYRHFSRSKPPPLPRQP